MTNCLKKVFRLQKKTLVNFMKYKIFSHNHKILRKLVMGQISMCESRLKVSMYKRRQRRDLLAIR